MEHDSSDEGWSDVEETEHHDHPLILCLFCKETFQIADKCLGHLVEAHKFDIIAFCKSNKIDFYGFIKLVNYIRAKGLDENAARGINQVDFSSEDFLMPVLAEDGMLQIDFDGLVEDCEVYLENGSPAMEHDEKLRLEKKLMEAERRAAFAEESLAWAVDDLTKCKNEMQELLLKTSHDHLKGTSEGKQEAQDESRAYFESYAHHGIHEEMLKDHIRTEAYRDFILSNKEIFKDKVVLDIGCGTGILSMFAANAGAKLVIAVDQSDIAYQAMDIVRENNLHEVVKVIKGDAERLSMPEGVTKVDIIISEWMGYFLLFESMLDSVIRCRDKWLAKDGLVFPDSCSILLAGVSDEKTWDSKVGFWNEVYGYKMSCMKKYALEEPLIEVVQKDTLCTNAVNILSLDVNKAKLKDLEFATNFQMEVTRTGHCSGVVGYFDIGFCQNATNPVTFSTGCQAVPTHWKQTLFLFENKVQLVLGESLKGKISCKKDPKDKRALIIELRIRKQDDSIVVDKRYSLI